MARTALTFDAWCLGRKAFATASPAAVGAAVFAGALWLAALPTALDANQSRVAVFVTARLHMADPVRETLCRERACPAGTPTAIGAAVLAAALRLAAHVRFLRAYFAQLAAFSTTHGDAALELEADL